MLGRSVLVMAPIVVILGLTACIADEHVDPSSLVYDDAGAGNTEDGSGAGDGRNGGGRLCRAITTNMTCPVAVAVNGDDLTCRSDEACCMNDTCVPRMQACRKGPEALYECFSDNHCTSRTCCAAVTDGNLPPSVCGDQEKAFRLSKGSTCDCRPGSKRLCVDDSACEGGDTCQNVRLQIADPSGGPDFVRRAKLCAKP